MEHHSCNKNSHNKYKKLNIESDIKNVENLYLQTHSARAKIIKLKILSAKKFARIFILNQEVCKEMLKAFSFCDSAWELHLNFCFLFLSFLWHFYFFLLRSAWLKGIACWMAAASARFPFYILSQSRRWTRRACWVDRLHPWDPYAAVHRPHSKPTKHIFGFNLFRFSYHLNVHWPNKV